MTSARSDIRSSLGARALLEVLGHAGDASLSERIAALPPAQLDEFLRLAFEHDVAPLVHRSLQSSGALDALPATECARLESDRRGTALENLRKYGEFNRIAQALGRNGIPVIALKGLHLAELVYADISLRSMSDLDLLVPAERLGEAYKVLQALEYGTVESMRGAVQDILATSKCELGLAHRRSNLWLELHWTLSEPPERYAGLLEDAWRTAVRVKLGDADASVLSPELLLVHVCVHLAYSHVFVSTVRALCDVAEIVRVHPGLDWAAVSGIARKHGFARGVAATLRLAADNLAVQVPEAVRETLGVDTLDPVLLADAAEHLLSSIDIPHELRTGPNVVAVAGGDRLAERLALLWNRVFVTPAELTLLYGVPEGSPWLGFYYVVRLRDLARKYGAGLRLLKGADPDLAAAAARHARLARWVSGN